MRFPLSAPGVAKRSWRSHALRANNTMSIVPRSLGRDSRIIPFPLDPADAADPADPANPPDKRGELNMGAFCEGSFHQRWHSWIRNAHAKQFYSQSATF